mgnify:CR=1 FL=1
MKEIEKKIIERYNQRFPNSILKLSNFEYERFDAYNDKCVVEVKHRNEWYDRQLIEFDKFSYNSWYAHISNKKFFYVVASGKRIVIYNITDLNKKKYDYNWQYKEMPKQTEFDDKKKIVKFVGYLDLNILRSSSSVYEFEVV